MVQTVRTGGPGATGFGGCALMLAGRRLNGRRAHARRALAGAACTAALLGALAAPAAASGLAPAAGTHTPGAGAPRGDYLALGDSVTFGYREANTTPPPVYPDAASFVGYPEDVAAAEGFHVANAACPGETSASFIVEGVQSNGCENSPGGGPGYRTLFPLHVQYTDTQLQYAVRYLRYHPATSLVSLMIGANDGFLCQETTSDNCASELPSVLHQISSNVADILAAVRTQAGYTGQIVIVNYYSLDYSSPTADASSQALNGAMDRAAKPYSVRIADGYGVWKAAAAHSGGNSCTAGLLTQLNGGGCGVHPSAAGQALLALAVEKVVTK